MIVKSHSIKRSSNFIIGGLIFLILFPMSENSKRFSFESSFFFQIFLNQIKKENSGWTNRFHQMKAQFVVNLLKKNWKKGDLQHLLSEAICHYEGDPSLPLKADRLIHMAEFITNADPVKSSLSQRPSLTFKDENGTRVDAIVTSGMKFESKQFQKQFQRFIRTLNI